MRDEVKVALRAMEPALRQPTTSAEASFDLGDRIRALRKLITQHGDRWISVAKAKQFLNFDSEEYVEGWAGRGWLRSRTTSNGKLQLSLDDVLHQREVWEGLSAIDDGAPISPEEAMYLLRPHEYPRPPGYPESIRRAKPTR